MFLSEKKNYTRQNITFYYFIINKENNEVAVMGKGGEGYITLIAKQ